MTTQGEIKKMRLAFPIKKEKFSNFGHIEFFAPKTAVEKINKGLLASDDILRHLLIKKEKERVLKPIIRIAKPKTEKPPEEKTFAESPKETEELDKKIEEILEKI